MRDIFDTELRPKIKIAWIRGRGKLPFNKPLKCLNVGLHGSGKSTLVECKMERIVTQTRVYDLFGSRDNEGLAWCRVLPKEEVLFISGDSTEIRGRWHSSSVKDLTIKNMKKHRIVLSVSAFYGDIEEEFHGLNEILWKKLYRKQYWNKVEGLIVREGSNLIYSRIAVGKGQDQAKADFIYIVREARHMGYFIDIDTIRWTSIDKEMRDVSDNFFIKRVGVLGLPRDLRFVYRYISPYALMKPPPESFVVVSMDGPIGIGKFDFVEWHKKEKDNLIGELGLKFDRGEVPFYANAKNKRVGDPEHMEIIMRRSQPRDNSMRRIAETMNRSSRTINVHIDEHNKSIRKRGYCLRCRRVKSPHATIEV